MVVEATRRWPDTAWNAARFAKYAEPLDDASALAGDHRSDLVWAWACLEREPAPLAELEAGPIADARAHLATLGFASHVIDEAIQRGRTKLVMDGGLASYRGRGPLATFVRTAIVRLAIDDRRQVRREVEVSEVLAAPCNDPELEYMRKLYAEQLSAAARDAWTRLAPHERYILSLRIFDGLSIEELAKVYDIHRASAARRAAAARASLIAFTRTCLRERLAVGDDTVDSILRIVTTLAPLRDLDESDHRA
jgi:RNA polymerase sigma-70 factor (ECF subfamily)